MNVTENSSNPTFYEVYGSAGVSPLLIFVDFLRFLLAIASVTFNIALFYLSVHSKRLRSRCNFLIGFDSACSIATFLTNIPPFFIALSGKNFIAARICFWIQLVPAIGINLLLGAMLAVGLDRLISVAMPFWFIFVNPHIYVFGLLLLCFLYATYAISQLYPINLMQNTDRPVPCSLSDLYTGHAGQMLYYNAMIITGLTVLCYILIWMLFRFRKFWTSSDLKPEIDYTRRLFRSLAAIVTLVSLGYFLNALFLNLLPHLGLNNVQMVFASYFLHLITDLTGAVNAPVLYLLSTEYRKAFDEMFGTNLFRWKWNSTSNNNIERPVNITCRNTQNLGRSGESSKF